MTSRESPCPAGPDVQAPAAPAPRLRRVPRVVALGLVGVAAAWTLSAGLAPGAGLEPLTEARLEAAARRWAARGCEDYRVVVRVSADRLPPRMYAVTVRRGAVVRVERDGRDVAPERAQDLSVAGTFRLLREELGLLARPRNLRDAAGADLFARFDEATGRLVRYRRTLGDNRRYLIVEVLELVRLGHD